MLKFQLDHVRFHGDVWLAEISQGRWNERQEEYTTFTQRRHSESVKWSENRSKQSDPWSQ